MQDYTSVPGCSTTDSLDWLKVGDWLTLQSFCDQWLWIPQNFEINSILRPRERTTDPISNGCDYHSIRYFANDRKEGHKPEPSFSQLSCTLFLSWIIVSISNSLWLRMVIGQFAMPLNSTGSLLLLPTLCAHSAFPVTLMSGRSDMISGHSWDWHDA